MQENFGVPKNLKHFTIEIRKEKFAADIVWNDHITARFAANSNEWNQMVILTIHSEKTVQVWIQMENAMQNECVCFL